MSIAGESRRSFVLALKVRPPRRDGAPGEVAPDGVAHLPDDPVALLVGSCR